MAKPLPKVTGQLFAAVIGRLQRDHGLKSLEAWWAEMVIKKLGEIEAGYAELLDQTEPPERHEITEIS
jgi:dsRNA-specific ribonuclease